MKKNIIFVAVVLVVVILSLFIGVKIGEHNKEKWYKSYLPVVEGRGQQEAVNAVLEIFHQYPEVIWEDGRTVGKRVDYENDVHQYKIVWVKNSNGQIVIGRADSWSDIPMK